MALKTGLTKLEETEASWGTHAAGEKFFNMSLADYTAVVQAARDADALVADLSRQLEAAKNRRKDALKTALALELNVAKGIAGDSKHGEDSDLYEATGRVRKSERKTGLTRKKKNGGEDK